MGPLIVSTLHTLIRRRRRQATCYIAERQRLLGDAGDFAVAEHRVQRSREQQDLVNRLAPDDRAASHLWTEVTPTPPTARRSAHEPGSRLSPFAARASSALTRWPRCRSASTGEPRQPVRPALGRRGREAQDRALAGSVDGTCRRRREPGGIHRFSPPRTPMPGERRRHRLSRVTT